MDKKALRKYIREAKESHTEEQLQEFSDIITRRLLAHPRVIAADNVLAYWSLPDEVCTHGIVEDLLRMGKRVLLPKVVSDSDLTLHLYEGIDSLQVGAYGIREPVSPPLPWDAITQENSVAIVPGMAFDRHCHRLGRGKGYYDRLLRAFPYIYKIGVCFPFQLLDDVPFEPHDIVMDEVLNPGA